MNPLTWAYRFMTTWNKDRWELVVLSIPLARGLLFVLHLAPAQLNDEVVPDPWQLILLGLIGIGSLIAIIGVIRNLPIVERTGLHTVGPLSVIYGLASIASAPTVGTVAFVVYGMIAACCFTRAHEISTSMRIVNRRLGAERRPE